MKLLVLSTLCFLAVRGQSYFQRPRRQVVFDMMYGGSNGEYFHDYINDDYDIMDLLVGVRSITITYSNQVDSIQVTYLLSNKSLYEAPRRGSVKNINPPVNIKLEAGEYVRKIEGKTNGELVDQLSITTYKPKDFVMKKYGPFGGTGQTDFSTEGYVVAFLGKSGDELISIGVYHFPLAKRSTLFGGGKAGEQRLTFDQNPDTEFFPPIVKINKLFIYHEKVIHSIQAQYQLRGGATRLGKKFGGSGGKLTVAKFSSDEEILGIEGSFASDRICQLTFKSRRENLSQPLLYNGPFGWPGQACSMPYSLEGRVIGFSGIASSTIVTLGVYY